jgi:hypothetical protein
MLFAVTASDPTTYTLPDLGAAHGGSRQERAQEDLPLRQIAPVQLGDGLVATRVTGHEVVRIDDSHKVRVVVSHTFIRVPGSDDEFLLITGLSPNVELEPEIYDLFDAIAGTFHFLPPGKQP